MADQTRSRTINQHHDDSNHHHQHHNTIYHTAPTSMDSPDGMDIDGSSFLEQVAALNHTALDILKEERLDDLLDAAYLNSYQRCSLGSSIPSAKRSFSDYQADLLEQEAPIIAGIRPILRKTPIKRRSPLRQRMASFSSQTTATYSPRMPPTSIARGSINAISPPRPSPVIIRAPPSPIAVSTPGEIYELTHPEEFNMARHFGRRFVAQVTNLCRPAYGILSSLWTWLRPQRHIEILAVDTTPRGNKRRAVTVEDVTDDEMLPRQDMLPQQDMRPQHYTPSQEHKSTPQHDMPTQEHKSTPQHGMPGQFPEPQSSELTPPDSMDLDFEPPNTHHTADATTRYSGNAPSQPSVTTAEQMPAHTSAPRGNLTPPDSRPGSAEKDNVVAPVQPQPAQKQKKKILTIKDWEAAPENASTMRLWNEYQAGLQAKRAASQPLLPASTQKTTVLPPDARPSPTIQTRKPETVRDAEVDGVIARAHRVVLGSPTVQEARESLKARTLRKKQERQAFFEEKEARIAKQQQEARERIEQKQREDEEAARQKIIDEELRKAAELASLDEDLIQPLDSHWTEKVQKAMESKDARKVLATTVGGSELTRYDLGRVLPSGDKSVDGDGHSGWLNDETVNAWFEALVKSKKDQAGYVKSANTVPPVEAYNSAWYTNYKTKGGISSIRTWGRRKHLDKGKLLRVEKLYFPINGGGHWTLLVISPQERTIEYLDSMGGSAKPYFKVAREFLEQELGDKLYKEEEWKEMNGTRSTEQTNMSDCGVFTCYNGLASAKGRSFSHVKAERMKDARKEMVAILLNGGFNGDFSL